MNPIAPHTDPCHAPRAGTLTGRHVLAIFIAGFGLIFGVNFFMAYRAVSTFPGMEVSSSYADSQSFDLRRDAQEALGWTARVEVPGDGRLILHLLDRDGALVAPAELTALLTRPIPRWCLGGPGGIDRAVDPTHSAMVPWWPRRN